MCIIISVLVAAVALVVYAYVKLSRWTPEFDASVVDNNLQPEPAEREKTLPSRDSKGRFAKQQ